jgi:hypothetical protein
MTQQNEQDFWGDLSREWHEMPLSSAGEAALRARLKRQLLLQRVYLVSEILVAVLGFGTAVFAMWKDLVLGVLTLVFVLITIGLAVWARWGHAGGDLSTVTGMVDLAISSAERRLRYIDASYLSCALALIFAAAVVLIASARPPPPLPNRSPWVIAFALTYIALFIVGAYVMRRRTERMLQSYMQMRAALREQGGEG